MSVEANIPGNWRRCVENSQELYILWHVAPCYDLNVTVFSIFILLIEMNYQRDLELWFKTVGRNVRRNYRNLRILRVSPFFVISIPPLKILPALLNLIDIILYLIYFSSISRINHLSLLLEAKSNMFLKPLDVPLLSVLCCVIFQYFYL